MTDTIVDSLYSDFHDFITSIDKNSNLSLIITADDTFRKALLLASASYFEYRITSDLIEYFNDTSDNNQISIEFLKNKAINYQYHTYFDWKQNNANSFFGLFGESFKNYMKNQVQTDTNLEESIKAFLELGNDRNRLVHSNYGNFPLEKTAEEIFLTYKKAFLFVDSFSKKLREFQKLVTGK